MRKMFVAANFGHSPQIARAKIACVYFSSEHCAHKQAGESDSPHPTDAKKHAHLLQEKIPNDAPRNRV